MRNRKLCFFRTDELALSVIKRNQLQGTPSIVWWIHCPIDLPIEDPKSLERMPRTVLRNSRQLPFLYLERGMFDVFPRGRFPVSTFVFHNRIGCTLFSIYYGFSHSCLICYYKWCPFQFKSSGTPSGHHLRSIASRPYERSSRHVYVDDHRPERQEGVISRRSKENGRRDVV